MVDTIIETFDLTKNFKLKGHNKEIQALDNVNISINEGEIFGFLGPNGAGKTTMIQILTTILQPTSGYAIIDGFNILKKPRQAKERVALMLESSMLYYRITAYDNLKFFCKIYKVPNFKEKILNGAEEFGLTKWLNQYVSNYSSGMKMKLALLRTLLLERKIFFLDEPTLGLDVKSISFVINRLKKLDCTIFLTSHDMAVVEKLCNRIAFINNGKILKIGTKDDVKRLEHSEVKVEVEIIENKRELESDLSQRDFVKEIDGTKNGLIISLKERKYYKELASILSNYPFRRINEREVSLEELFLKLI